MLPLCRPIAAESAFCSLLESQFSHRFPRIRQPDYKYRRETHERFVLSSRAFFLVNGIRPRSVTFVFLPIASLPTSRWEI
ncbi:hypothetical protein J6590_015902 [Homalodisca vitripennis]|nr:hypothetical protein J6590_015902 [Homalodisca vitripennis]